MAILGNRSPQPFRCRGLICGNIFAKNEEVAKEESTHSRKAHRSWIAIGKTVLVFAFG
jgi:hypothetical protein